MIENEQLVKIIKQYSKNKKIVFWGGWGPDYQYKKELVNLLEKDEEFCVTTTKDSIGENEDHKKILPIEMINGLSNQYYVICFPKQTDNIDQMFLSYGFTRKDYFYLHPCDIVIQGGNYEDEHGNKVINIPQNVKVILNGYNNYINIGNIRCDQLLEIKCSSNCIVNISDNVYFENTCRMFLGDVSKEREIKSSLYIGSNCKFKSMELNCFSGDIMIQDNTSFGRNFQITCSCGFEILIGKDSMFSHDIVLLSGDGHTRFNLDTKKATNNYDCLEEACRKIVIGEHVWVGWRAMILNGTEIGMGSQIGAETFIKNKFKNNVIIAGKPARVIKKNIAWTREPICDDIECCVKQYAMFTDE